MSERDNFYKFLKKVAIGPAIEVAFHPWVEGLDNIPETGPAILASNHLSFSDSIFLPIAVPRKITFMAKSEYFEGPGIRGKATAAFYQLIGLAAMPVPQQFQPECACYLKDTYSEYIQRELDPQMGDFTEARLG